jgi:hypothetical protein
MDHLRSSCANALMISAFARAAGPDGRVGSHDIWAFQVVVKNPGGRAVALLSSSPILLVPASLILLTLALILLKSLLLPALGAAALLIDLPVRSIVSWCCVCSRQGAGSICTHSDGRRSEDSNMPGPDSKDNGHVV